MKESGGERVRALVHASSIMLHAPASHPSKVGGPAYTLELVDE